MQNLAPRQQACFGGFMKRVQTDLPDKQRGEHARRLAERRVRQPAADAPPESGDGEGQSDAASDGHQRVERSQLKRRCKHDRDLHRLANDDERCRRGERETISLSRPRLGVRFQRRGKTLPDPSCEPDRQRERQSCERGLPQCLAIARLKPVGGSGSRRERRDDAPPRAGRGSQIAGATKPRQAEHDWEKGLEPLRRRTRE